MKTIILASGGTGGHIFPAQAVSVELRKRGYRTILVTDKRFKDYAKGNPEMEEAFSKIHFIQTGNVSGNMLKKIVAAKDIGVGYFQAVKIIKNCDPCAVIGFGGYPSFPTMYAACNLAEKSNIKVMLHEQNSVLGHANAMVSHKVHKIASSFTDVKGIAQIDKEKVVLTGNPVRQNIKIIRDFPFPELNEDSLLKILVLGGSQGASILSRVIPAAFEELSDEMRKKIRIDQQCRPEDIDEARAKYKEMGMSAELATFFDDVPARLATAHLVICRAGASTVSELSVAGRPSILVPYKFAKYDHQTINAKSIEERGGGWIMQEDDFTPEELMKRIQHFVLEPSLVKDAAEQIKASAIYDADIRLANLVEKMIDQSPQKRKEDKDKEISSSNDNEKQEPFITENMERI